MGQDITTLQKRILQRFLMLAFIAGIGIFGVLVYPLYEKMNDEALTEIKHVGSLKKALLESEVQQMIMVSKQISSRTILKDMLTQYNQGTILEAGFQERSARLLQDAIKASNSILGINRFDANKELVIELGKKIDFSRFNLGLIDTKKDFVFGLVDYDDESLFYAISHILDEQNKSIGFDVVIFNDTSIKDILEKKEHSKDSEIIFCIGANNKEGFYPILSNNNPYDVGEKTSHGSMCGDKEISDIHKYDIKDSNIEFRVMFTEGIWSENINSKIIRIVLVSVLIFLVAAAWGTLSTGTLFGKLKEQQASLETLLKEKSTLLNELNHRTLNNLQMMLSIIRIKTRTTESQEVRRVLSECQNRLQSIAFIQERVFRLDSFRNIDTSLFLPSIIENIKTIHDHQDSILTIDIEKISMQTKKASLCALIINELLTNVYKHAFSQDSTQEHRVSVSLRSIDQDNLLFIVEDNGIGITDSSLENNEEGIGVNLVKDMIEKQLHGSYKIIVEKGTRWEIYFKGEADA